MASVLPPHVHTFHGWGKIIVASNAQILRDAMNCVDLN